MRVSKKRRIVLPGEPPNPVDRPAGCAFHPRCRARRRALPRRDAGAAHAGRRPAGRLPSRRTDRRERRLMLRYLAGRLLRAILTIFLVITFAFFVLHLSGDPAMMILSVDAPPESIKAFREAWGLDRPLWVQYLAYIVPCPAGRPRQLDARRPARAPARARARAGDAGDHRAGVCAQARASAFRRASTPRFIAIHGPTG